MHETPEDLRALQRLLDESYERGGAHLRSIFTPDKRLDAASLSRLLTGVRVLNLATVTAACEPRVAPVDGLFFRGRFWFGSSPDSVRFRHIRARPQVSAAHTIGEELAVVVHGVAGELDIQDPAQAPFRDYCVEVYGKEWLGWYPSGVPYAWIEAHRMFTFHNPRD